MVSLSDVAVILCYLYDLLPFQVDFTPPFRRVNIYSGLQEKLGIEFPPPQTLETDGWFAP